jgi:hypothetical protein
MKKILFFTLLLFLNACGKSEKVFSKLPSDAVIMAFGDSLGEAVFKLLQETGAL